MVLVGDENATVKRFYATESTVTLVPSPPIPSTSPKYRPAPHPHQGAWQGGQGGVPPLKPRTEKQGILKRGPCFFVSKNHDRRQEYFSVLPRRSRPCGYPAPLSAAGSRRPHTGTSTGFFGSSGHSQRHLRFPRPQWGCRCPEYKRPGYRRGSPPSWGPCRGNDTGGRAGTGCSCPPCR